MLTSILPCYVYQQYNDDPNIVAFFAALNNMQQSYLDAFNALNLPIYTQDPVSGVLLDWVALGLYGLKRPYLPAANSSTQLVGAYNTVVYNRLPYNSIGDVSSPDFVAVNDDVFRRVITWWFYKGDGTVLNIAWLKRRIERFLTGANGVDPGISSTLDISVTFTTAHDVTITLAAATTNAALFKQAMDSGILQVPFQYVFTVTLT